MARRSRLQASNSWKIVVYDDVTPRFECSIPVGQISQARLKTLLQVLAAKHCLTDAEIVGCFLRRNATEYRADLEVRQDNIDAERRTNFYCCGLSVVAHLSRSTPNER